MDSDEMIKRINNGETLIDITIQKWKDVTNGIGFCSGILNCALCYVYFKESCASCQISRFTGLKGCNNTPFRDWYAHYMEEHFGMNDDTRRCDVCKDIANREVVFLEQVKSKAFLQVSP